MFRIIFHNNEAMSANNLVLENGVAAFKDIAGNYVTIPLTSIKMIVKMKEAQAEEPNEGSTDH